MYVDRYCFGLCIMKYILIILFLVGCTPHTEKEPPVCTTEYKICIPICDTACNVHSADVNDLGNLQCMCREY